ncbi:cellulose biosynthesis cyclic di-GMP-binding regulatory protein BcsB [Caldichromatium japonicum]|uniref:cellulose biosynthesis cyclic di-GMP-binding regulatory protein BcsB n=1 Tax=Caldichromatium japonicum TaxID=2699430 RepID=UPI003CCE3738
MRLDLVYRNSISLLAAHSQLQVELNGLIIAQLKLDPARPEGRAQICLPLDLLQSGYNRLAFSVAQHTLVGECEDLGAPELWTQIDTQASRLILDYERIPLEPRLTSLEALFDPRLWTQETWPILMPSSAAQLDDDQLAWGALVAQAIGKRLEFKPPRIESIVLDNQNQALRDLSKLTESLTSDAILVAHALSSSPSWAMRGAKGSAMPILPSCPIHRMRRASSWWSRGGMPRRSDARQPHSPSCPSPSPRTRRSWCGI